MVSSHDLLDELRVKPGSAPGLDERDPDARVGAAGASRKVSSESRLSRRAPRRAAHAALGGGDARRCCSSSRGWTPRARTGRSARSSPASTRRAAASQSFKAPTVTELAHDYLWRIHERLPGARRDRDLQPLALRGRRRRARAQARAGAGVARAATSTSARSSACSPTRARPSSRCSCTSRTEEQRKRLQERLDDPEKRWKFRARRSRRPRALGRLHRRLRGRAPRDVDRLGAVVRRARRPQLVAQPGRRGDPRRRARASRPETARARPCDPQRRPSCDALPSPCRRVCRR